MAAGTVYSVGQVNAYVARMFSEDYLLRRITVRGEVSNCTYHSSGHIYFTLKDASGTLSCMMYAGKRLGGLSFRMTEGDAVVITGQVRVYERQGKYQLYAEQIVRDGVGLLNERYELLKKKLEEMGMFAEEYKQPIPRYIRRLGVVTAPTGAAVRDIIQIAKRRNPYVEILLYPAIVQGDQAPESIIRGIRLLDHAGVDVIIAGRGGGSIEDLWAFNEEAVAQAVFECTTPIISAVGHEVDTVITDYVADLRAPTPSAAAELAVFDWNQFQSDLLQQEADLRGAMLGQIDLCRRQCKELGQRLELRSPKRQLQMQRMAADELERHIREVMQKRLEKCRGELTLSADLRRVMRERLLRSRQELRLQKDLQTAMERSVERSRHELALLAAGLERMSPAARLAGGYGFLTGADGRPVTGAAALHPGDTLHIRLRDGSVTAIAEKIETEDGIYGTEEVRG